MREPGKGRLIASDVLEDTGFCPPPPMELKLRKYTDNLAQDFLASLVVFLIAVPLCLGISVAVGLPPMVGLLSGIIGGLVVGTFAGNPFQVSGPPAGLITVVAAIIHEHGAENLGVIIMVAGLLQLSLGVMNLGPWFRAVSPTVIQGMLSGIGVLIFASQFHIMMDDEPKTGGLNNLISIPQAVMKGLFPLENTSHHLAAGIGLLTIVLIIAWDALRKRRPWMTVPGVLIGIVIATLVAVAFQLPIRYLDVPANPFSQLALTGIGKFGYMFQGWLPNGPAFISAITLAVVASAETLLTATAVDTMHQGKRTNYNREMLSQGIGNMTAGWLGALPITGVIVRSAANVQAGAKTRMSTIMHGFWILLFLTFLPWVLTSVPKAGLAAILVYTGYKLMNFKAFNRFLKISWGEAAIYAITVITIVTTNLLEGIVLGFVLSLVKLVYSATKLNVEVEEVDGSQQIVMHMRGFATFLMLPRLSSALEKIPEERWVKISMNGLTYMDHACQELLDSWKERYRATGGRVDVIDEHTVEMPARELNAEAEKTEADKKAIDPATVETEAAIEEAVDMAEHPPEQRSATEPTA